MKLTEQQIKDIRKRVSRGAQQKTLALHYRVSPACISQIVNLKRAKRFVAGRKVLKKLPTNDREAMCRFLRYVKANNVLQWAISKIGNRTLIFVMTKEVVGDSLIEAVTRLLQGKFR